MSFGGAYLPMGVASFDGQFHGGHVALFGSRRVRDGPMKTALDAGKTKFVQQQCFVHDGQPLGPMLASVLVGLVLVARPGTDTIIGIDWY